MRLETVRLHELWFRIHFNSIQFNSILCDHRIHSNLNETQYKPQPDRYLRMHFFYSLNKYSAVLYFSHVFATAMATAICDCDIELMCALVGM